ncbi:CNNM domain-containing protein [Desulfopila inferna]|uniref:CNNM domain-containing protein n=1 Tax=Desulfopila inferna TaxID=468528 RepID=UPI0019647861|nr:hemolysin family protein [Desulfopila inferna]MBM9606557.1 HlyC/CorC family transporter [Desulfopila inferna]
MLKQPGHACKQINNLKGAHWLPLLVALILGLSVPAYSVEAVTDTHLATTTADVILLIMYVLLALVFSFLCSVAEAVLLSITPSYIESQKENRPKRAALLQYLKHDNVDRSLAAILTLNTIAHTIGAIGAGAQASIVFGSTWFGVFSAAMTLMILFFSEIIPKTIGAVYWPHLVGFTTLFVRFLINILYPIVWLSEKVTRIISHDSKLHIFSRDEFIAMARVGVQTGGILDNESLIIKNLLQLQSIAVLDVMTPSTVVSALPEDMTIPEAMVRISKTPFSRLLLYKNNFENITGFVLRDDILLKKAHNHDEETLKSLKRDISVVPGTISVSLLLDRFLKERRHIALVVDEHGSMRGLVTLEDLLETLIGVEIMDEMDKVEDMRVFARKLWMDRAKALGIEDQIIR